MAGMSVIPYYQLPRNQAMFPQASSDQQVIMTCSLVPTFIPCARKSGD